jgi:hypothetical protein
MAPANSNHCPAVILHTTRRSIKNNLAIKICELANRHKAHGKTGNMGDRWDREGVGMKIASGGDR